MRKSFHLKYDVTRGLQFDEFREMIESEYQSNARTMLDQIRQLQDGQTTWLASTFEEPMKRESNLVYGEFIDGKYNVLNVQATQVKVLDERKLAACGLGALCMGLVVGSLSTPVGGTIAAGSILAASGAKAAYDYKKGLPDVIYGYIFKELSDKGVITGSNGRLNT
ncbi:unnamed protein product [Rotaria sp. Silwood1]|nr:unnamed protein product [Rotaria sp. Silwood1]CAF1177716.1 unnamed protein product [Rotaria sp. Silwood1]CAF1189933.1 unnamed protein product [Rotaria sp. Silwood1]CAF3481509.1 unnamed protein product [Rotaria sp. Silwood1]CAF4702913.1 unnamed protein product [Rotaria sp. Silwood1]